MSASSTGMKRYIRDDGNEVFAEQIATISDYPNPDNHPNIRGAKVLTFTNGRVANLVPSWAAKYPLQVGGYFVAFDINGKVDAIYEPEVNFNAYYKAG